MADDLPAVLRPADCDRHWTVKGRQPGRSRSDVAGGVIEAASPAGTLRGIE